MNPRTGAVVSRESSAKHLPAWRRAVSLTAISAINRWTVERPGPKDPVFVTLAFWFHETRDAPHGWRVIDPDIDKLTRAVLDALTGSVYPDDRQVCSLSVTTRNGPANREGVDVRVEW